MRLQSNLPDDLNEALETINRYGLLGVGCCHITGMHNPNHFVNGKFVCEYQLSNGFKLLRHLARYLDPRPGAAEPCPTRCGWCQELDTPIPVGRRDQKWIDRDIAGLRPTLITAQRLTFSTD